MIQEEESKRRLDTGGNHPRTLTFEINSNLSDYLPN